MLTIRRLLDTDDQLFAEIERWRANSPSWRQEPIDPGAARIDIGVFDDGELIADVVLVLQAKDIYEVHLEAKRGASLDTIIEAGRTIRDQMFGYGMQLAFVWVPRQHREVKEIIKAIGFQPDYVSMLQGNGRLVERERFSLRSTDGR